MRRIVEPIRNKKDILAVEKYLARKKPRNRMIFSFGINTGLRISDILALNVGDVRGKNYIKIIEKKTCKFKSFPINDKLKKLLKDFIQNRSDDEPLFFSQKKHRLDPSQAYRMLNEACTAVGIDINVGTHTMRKTFGYHHYKKFKDIALLQSIFNHSHPSITLCYIGINQDEINNSYMNFEL